jgi:hypothetical protein
VVEDSVLQDMVLCHTSKEESTLLKYKWGSDSHMRNPYSEDSVVSFYSGAFFAQCTAVKGLKVSIAVCAALVYWCRWTSTRLLGHEFRNNYFSLYKF